MRRQEYHPQAGMHPTFGAVHHQHFLYQSVDTKLSGKSIFSIKENIFILLSRCNILPL